MLVLCLASCVKANSNNVVVPDVVAYDIAVQTLAAYELESMGPPCPRDAVIPGCSAVHRMTIDYGDMRDQARAISATN